jgi:hypothetical protein
MLRLLQLFQGRRIETGALGAQDTKDPGSLSVADTHSWVSAPVQEQELAIQCKAIDIIDRRMKNESIEKPSLLL